MDWDIPTAMDDFYRLVNAAPATEAADRLARMAATMPADISITALARLYVVAAARVRHVEAKLAARDIPGK